MRLLPRSRTGKIVMVCSVLLICSSSFLALEQYVQPVPPLSQEEAGARFMAKPAGGPQLGEMLVRTVVALIALLALLYLGVFALKRYVLQKNGAGRAFPSLSVIGSTFLGAKKAIYLVQVLDRILILGVTDAQVSLLSEITDQETLKSLHDTRQKPAGGSFAEHLSSVLQGLKKNDR